MYEVDVIKQIYTAVSDVLLNSNDLSYIRTRQKGFRPIGENLVSPMYYPYLFTEYGSVSEIENPRTLIWEYIYTMPIVILTIADLGDFSDLIYNTDGKNRNKGIGEIVHDTRRLLWRYHDGNFGIDAVRDWKIGAIHSPNVLSIQRLLVSEFVRGLQIDLVFRVWEQD